MDGPSIPVGLRHVRRVSGWLHRLHSAKSLDEIAETAVQAMQRLIACDWAAVSLGPAFGPGKRHFWSPKRDLQRALTPAAREFALQHPVWRHFLDCRGTRALRLSDLVSTPELHDLAVYREVLHPLDVERMAAVCLPGGIDLALSAARSRGPDFTMQDTVLLDVICQHCALAIRRRAGCQDGMLCGRDLRRPLVKLGLIVVDSAGRVLRSTPAARQLLGRHFPAAARHMLPDVLRRWHASSGRTAFRRRSGAFELQAQPLDGLGQSDHLILREVPLAGHEAMQQLCMRAGLTPRECQVACCVAAGKSNCQIAATLNMRERTVKKHLEHIFAKLGIDSRLALATMLISLPKQ